MKEFEQLICLWPFATVWNDINTSQWPAGVIRDFKKPIFILLISVIIPVPYCSVYLISKSNHAHDCSQIAK
jgi:hypothetical protein